MDAQAKTKLQQIEDRESRRARELRGPFGWIVAALGAVMVFTYMYAAGVQPLGTQYHLGTYVLITFVLALLIYPAGSRIAVGSMSILTGTLLGLLATSFLIYESPAALWAQIAVFRDTLSYDGLNVAIENDLGKLHWIAILALPAIAVLLPLDQYLSRRFHRTPTASDVLLALAIGAAVVYWISQFQALNYRAGAENGVDRLVSIVGLILALEITRRVLGWAITIIGLAFIGFALFGPHLPEVIAHRGFAFDRLATSLFLTTNGLFGTMSSVLATYVILFIFFGAFLQKSGAGRFFIDLPLALAGRSTGGPAKVAVLSSALFGSVSGSAIANTVSSGAFTIPMMKRAGFKPHVAGAVEPAASIGGAFLPPIMGAGGFLMAELTGTPYSTIMILSLGPALLYFLSIFSMVHFEAAKHGLHGVVGDEVPHWKAVLRGGWFYALPLVIMTVMMLSGYSPSKAAFWATLSCIAVSWVRPETRMGFKEIWDAIQTGARGTLLIGATMGVIGVIVGVISLTGIGLKFSDLLISLAGNSLLLTLILIAIASLVLGMGVPVTAAYLIVAVLAVPALGTLGVAPIAAHMIVYWLSQDSNITPPVCVAAYAGAAIAGANPNQTGLTALKFAKLLYVMPVLFAYVPAILLDGTTSEIVTAYISATLGTIAFGAFAMGYLRRRTTPVEWIVLGVATFLLYWPNLATDAAGLLLVALVWWLQRDAHKPSFSNAAIQSA